jgi:dienelactone hydrolase
VLAALMAACGGRDSRAASPLATTRATAPPSAPSTSTSTSTTTVQVTSGAVAVGTYAVGTRTEEVVDSTRPTPANGGAPGSPTRSMPTTIWYPATGDPAQPPRSDAPPDPRAADAPLVVFAHGFDTTPATYAELLSRWASAGYVVVAPAIPLLNADAPGGASHADYGSPNIADFRYSVDDAVRAAGPGGALSGMVDPQRVAVTGHSDGEVLAYALALEACCRDPNVDAAMLLAGDLDNARALPATTAVQVLHVIADLDEYNPYGPAIDFDRAHLGPSSYSLTLRSAHHEPPFVDPTEPHFALVARTTVDFLDLALKQAPDAGARLRTDAAADGLATLEAHGRSGTP